MMVGLRQKDKSLSAQFEHTIETQDGCEVFTLPKK